MKNETWLAIYFAVVVGIFVVFLQQALTSGWTPELLVTCVVYCIGGLLGAVLVRGLAHVTEPLRTHPRRRWLVLATTVLCGASVLASGGWWLIGRRAGAASPARSSPDAVLTLGQELADREWVLSDENCARDGLKFLLEGRDLVAYPKGADALRFRLGQAYGHQLTADLNGSPVSFEIRGDGFTYIEGGHARWYALCGSLRSYSPRP